MKKPFSFLEKVRNFQVKSQELYLQKLGRLGYKVPDFFEKPFSFFPGGLFSYFILFSFM